MKESQTTIASFWKESDEQATEAVKAKRLKALQREGEMEVAKYGNESEAADAALEDAIRNAKANGTTMASLFTLKRAAKVAKAKHTDVLADYEEFFGEKPKLQ